MVKFISRGSVINGAYSVYFFFKSEKSHNNRRQYQESIHFTFRFCSHAGKEKECRLYHLKDALKTYECENKAYDKKPPHNC